MTRTISALAEIGATYDAVLCDLWGCLHNGVIAFPEAVKALQDYRVQGGKVLLLTNSPRPKSQVILQLDQLGVPRDAWDEIATSGDAAQAAMTAGQFGTKVHHIGPERDLPFFTDMEPDIRADKVIERVPLKEAEGIVCTGLDNDDVETPKDYRARLLLAKQDDLPLLCANPDVVVDRGEKRIYCAGAIAELYAEMGGRSFYFGKPHPPIYDLARRRLAGLGRISDDRVLVIGDGPATDVKGGILENFDTLFVTGGLAAEQTGTAEQPDPAKLAAYLEETALNPTYAIGRLR
ncbi:TIGR01459 family HAD-type hydrolase [Mangrovicoccus sp. HB161399]|uniref:TIGR01459 family HAD-type hydrolase n=1 Tax=Mangrovicoccus sp. HB161399 TaxID=2720392 RepID=UPI0015554445|nr:TIGR01459 family HAD-type hydrolase [Mangrovicoccus sp. HB161399]